MIQSLMRPVRLARERAHTWRPGTLAVIALALLFNPGGDVWADDLDRSVVVFRLAPSALGPRQILHNATGHAAVDQVLAQFGVSDLRQVFPPLRVNHRLSEKSTTLGMTDVVRITVPETVDAETLLKTIRDRPEVEWAEFDVIVRITDATIAPNDTYFLTRQYPLRNTGSQPPADPGTAGADMEMEAAWEHATGDPDVILAIIDTGIDFEHPDLAGRLWYNLDEGIDGIDEDGNGYVSDWRGWNFANNNNNPDDDHSHGTHCAGIAGAESNNGIGIAGMDWQCNLMALKALNSSGSGTAANVAEAIYYAANNGAHVISMSLGSFSASSAEELAIDYAMDAGVTVVAAMGNDDVATPHYPAAFPKVIAVGGTDSDDRRALPFCGSPGSNYGDYIDVCAAGNWVWSTVPVENGNYGYKCGTSMATPHVAGLATLIKALRPDFTPQEVRALIRASAEDQVGRPTEDTPGFDIYHGYGRINGRIALQALTTDFPPIISVPGAQVVTEMDMLEFSISATDSNFTPLTLSFDGLPNADFVDNGDGTGGFSFEPDLTQAGVYNLAFIASDGTLADTGFVEILVLPGCLCPYPGDFNEDDALSAVDLTAVISVVFFGGDDLEDPRCPTTRADFNCNAAVNAVDLTAMVDHVFFGGLGPCDACAP